MIPLRRMEDLARRSVSRPGSRGRLRTCSGPVASTTCRARSSRPDAMMTRQRRGVRVEVESGHLLVEPDVRPHAKALRGVAGCTAGSPASPRSAGSSRACPRTSTNRGATARRTRRRDRSCRATCRRPRHPSRGWRNCASPAASSLMAMHRPPKPAPTMATSSSSGVADGRGGDCCGAFMAPRTVLRFASRGNREDRYGTRSCYPASGIIDRRCRHRARHGRCRCCPGHRQGSDGR